MFVHANLRATSCSTSQIVPLSRKMPMATILPFTAVSVSIDYKIETEE